MAGGIRLRREPDIWKSIIASEGGAAVKAPKTRAGVRTITIDDETMQCLEETWLIETDLATMCDLAVHEKSFVFSFAHGGAEPPYSDLVSTAFTRIRARVGVAKDIHLHSLRHFQATCLDPVISERQKQARMGWATVQRVWHYTDTINEKDHRAAAHVDGLLQARKKSTGPVQPTSSLPPPQNRTATPHQLLSSSEVDTYDRA